MCCRILKLLLLFVVPMSSSLAKGLDDIQPTTPEEKASQPTPSADGATTPNGSGSPQVSAASATAPMTKSALSKALDNKLAFSTSMGFVRITNAEQGEYRSQGMADFSILWSLSASTVQDHRFLLSLRYAPVHSENEIDGQSYRSIIEGYHLGGHYRYGISKTLALLATCELGYLLVYQESRDRYDVQADTEANEIAYTIGTGLDWTLTEKVTIGPRLYAGFGNIQMVQFTGAATFLF